MEIFLENILEEVIVNVTGHRPAKKYNTEFMYNFKHPETIKLKEELLILFEDLIVNHNATSFITGGALGFDQICFWVVEILKKKYPHIKNIVAIPFKKYNYAWKKKECTNCFYITNDKKDYKNSCERCTFKATQEMYYKMLKRADEIVYVDTVKGYTFNNVGAGEYFTPKLNKRNEYMVDRGNLTIAYWNGLPSGTKNCIDYAKGQNKQVINILKGV